MPPLALTQTNGSLILRCAGERLDAHEAIAALAKDPLYRARLVEERGQKETERAIFSNELWLDTLTVLRTGGHFIFSCEDITPELVEVTLGSPRSVLPPMPFPRMWLEINDPDLGLTRILDLDGRPSLILGLALIEVTPCTHWEVLVPLLDQERGRELDRSATEHDLIDWATAIRRWEIVVRDGSVQVLFGEQDLVDRDALPPNWAAMWERFLCVLPEVLVELVHLCGVTLMPQHLPRQTRREFHRRFGVSHPSLYWVHLGAATEGHPGSGDRMFYHRWLVRGHYRRDARGGHEVPGKGLCVWVRPYIKGPDGAPWKGRGVYASATLDTATA